LRFLISTKNVLYAILQRSKETQEVSIDQIAEQTKLSNQQVIEIIANLNEDTSSKLSFNKNTIYIPRKNKAQIILKVIESGFDLDRIIDSLHWSDFENFCLTVFEFHEFQTFQNFHFTQKRNRYEIDVLGFRDPLMFAIDAKKWKTGHAGALKAVAKKQIDRIKALSEYLQKPANQAKLHLKNVPNLRIIPLIVTSKMYEIQIFHGVPIIPFFKLNSFITELSRFLGILKQFPVKIRVQKTLLSYNFP